MIPAGAEAGKSFLCKPTSAREGERNVPSGSTRKSLENLVGTSLQKIAMDDTLTAGLVLVYSTQKVGCVGVCWGVLQQKHIPPGNLWGVAGTPQWYTPESGV